MIMQPRDTRLLVLTAGSASGNNLIRALKAGKQDLCVVGCHDDPFALQNSAAEWNYLIPEVSSARFETALHHIIAEESIHLVIPNSDLDVLAISELKAPLGCRTFLPSKAAIELCQDKYDLTEFLSHRGIPVAQTYAVDALTKIEEIFLRFPSHPQLWCRSRRGTGSVGAAPVRTPEQARSWIRYWEDVRGLPAGSFTISEYLPGRDLMVQCLFKNGIPVMAKMFERLSYHTLNAVPSGVSSMAAIAKMVFEPAVLQSCIRAMVALDPAASCIYFADLKENRDGQACITEINAGRFSNLPAIHDQSGQDNMCLAYVLCAFDEAVEFQQPCGRAEDCYVLRGVDSLPVVLHGRELFKGFKDAR